MHLGADLAAGEGKHIVAAEFSTECLTMPNLPSLRGYVVYDHERGVDAVRQ